jgi:gluconolactonase
MLKMEGHAMYVLKHLTICFVGLCLISYAVDAAADCKNDFVPNGTPLAKIDLATEQGVNLVEGAWRYSDVRIIETDFLDAGPDGQPGTKPNRAYDLDPHAGGRGFDDASWEVISPTTLSQRRSAGKLSFNWYRIRITVPESIEGFDPTGSTLVFQTSVDDYAEIWVDGELPRLFGQCGGSMVMGWNAPNRLVIGRNVMPDQEIQLAIFGINGPISQSPTNYIFMRYARLEFYPGGWSPVAVAPREVNVKVLRLDPSLDEIVPKNPKLFKLAEGFTFVEGPVWQDGSLLFSDPNENRIYRYTADGRLSIFRKNSGYAAADIDRYRQPGSNGLTLDAKGHLTISEHGNRRITRLENDGSLTVLAYRYGGKRLNSPNDLVYNSDGSLYFTDPPFGLPGMYADPKKELSYSGIFRLKDGEMALLSEELKGPNGIAFSPDEKYLYVGNWDPEKKVVMRYPVITDGALGKGEIFFDMTAAPHPEAIDGLKVDVKGNVYVSGPGGMWILSAAGKHLGTVLAPRPIHNFAWGGKDGKTLYLTAQDKLYRMNLLVEGVRPE